MMKKLPSRVVARNSEICHRWGTGEPVAELASEFNMHEKTIQQLVEINMTKAECNRKWSAEALSWCNL